MINKYKRPRLPVPGRPDRKRSERFLLLCFFDPRGISTVCENIACLQYFSQFSIEIFNFFGKNCPHTLPADLPWADYCGIILHNTLSYNVEVLESLDQSLKVSLGAFDGIKILMKQDEHFRASRLAPYAKPRSFDLILTCIDESEREKVYPRVSMGDARFMQMLTGYVSPDMRAMHFSQDPSRPIDIGYRGSIQPLIFGRLAYEKRQIGQAVKKLAIEKGLKIDISSRWEDRFFGDEWTRFLSSCKATLGVESGASIFDLNGSVEARYRAIIQRDGEHADDADWCEHVLGELAVLENNVHYAQISPRHFEAAATRTVQILYEGNYSGIFTPWRHFWPLRRDFKNFGAIVDQLRDAKVRIDVTNCAFEEVIENPKYWVETFVQGLDEQIETLLDIKGLRRTRILKSNSAPRHVLLLSPHRPDLDPRFGWLVRHAPKGILIHTVGLHDDPSLPALQHSTDVSGAIRIEARRGKDSTGWMVGMNELHTDFGGGRGALSLLNAVSRLDEKMISDRFGLDLTTKRGSEFLRFVDYFARTASTLIQLGLSFHGVDGIIAADLDTLAAGVVLKELMGAPLIYDAHEFWPDSFADFHEWEVRFWTNYERMLIERVNASFCVSLPLSEYMSRLYGRAFRTVPNCEPISDERGVDYEGCEKSRSMGRVPEFHGKVRFLYQGLFARGRGLEALIHLWPRTDARAVLILRGPRNSYSRILEETAANIGLTRDRIVFLDPVKVDDLVARASQDADVGLVPYEPINVNNRFCCPNKVSQYMAAGLPVLSNRLDYVKLLIEEGNLGLAADLGNAHDFAAAVDRLVRDDSLRRSLGKNARRFFEERFNWQTVSQPLYDTLQELTGEVGSPREIYFMARAAAPHASLWRTDPWGRSRELLLATDATTTDNESERGTGKTWWLRKWLQKRVATLRTQSADPNSDILFVRQALYVYRKLPHGLRQRVMTWLG